MTKTIKSILKMPDDHGQETVESGPGGLGPSIHSFTGSTTPCYRLPRDGDSIEFKLSVTQAQNANLNFKLKSSEDTSYEVSVTNNGWSKTQNGFQTKPPWSGRMVAIQDPYVDCSFSDVPLKKGDNTIRLELKSGTVQLYLSEFSADIQVPNSGEIDTNGTNPETEKTTPVHSYKSGDEVEVRVNGFWQEGVYKRNLSHYSNMKATPHNVAYTTFNGSGSGNFSDDDIRPRTGNLKKPVDPEVKPSTVNIADLEQRIIEEVNKMRSNPSAYADKLEELKNKYVHVENQSWYLNMPEEGGEYLGRSKSDRESHEEWLNETIEALKKISSLPTLKPNNQLHQAADYFASDPGPVDGENHKDSHGRSAAQRAELAGYTGGVNECIPGDQRTAFGTVVSLLIDWKVDSRGHRKNLMNKDTKQIGVACHYFPEQTRGGFVYKEYIRTAIQCGYK